MQYVIQKGIPKTEGVLEFIAWNEKKHFPNLGSIKKASIKNHIELLSKLV